MKVPKDLGIKVGSKKQAEYEKILRSQKEVILNSEINKEVAEFMVEFA